jgi:F-type H+-transporting ATPase subunit gamma
MGAVLSNLARTLGNAAGAPRLLAGTGKDQVHLLVVCTADRGLCGAFNSSISRLARDHANRLIRDGKEVKILCVGKKGYDALRRLFPRQILDVIELRAIKQIGFGDADAIGKRVLSLYADGQFDVATLYYAQFKSVISQIPTARQLIPAQVDGGANDNVGGSASYEYEPDEEAILTDLLPRNLSVQIFRALLENVASEQGAKMSAMDNATRNAGDMIDRYTMQYNRSRQAQITKELIEIISGAEAL